MMNKTTFKNEMIENGFDCLHFKTDMIFEMKNFLVNVSQIDKIHFNVFLYDTKTGNGVDLVNNKPLSNYIINAIKNNINDMIEFFN